MAWASDGARPECAARGIVPLADAEADLPFKGQLRLL